jgi:hypothetical protein
MSSAKLIRFQASLQEEDFLARYKKWLLFAAELLRRRKLEGMYSAEEVVSSTWVRIMDDRRGHICPPGTHIQDFLLRKVETTIYRLAKRRDRSRERHVDLAEVADFWVRPILTGTDLATLVHDGPVMIKQALADRKVGTGIHAYVKAIPNIVELGLSSKEAADLVGKEPATLAKYRFRIGKIMAEKPKK